MDILTVKALHIIFIVTWFAGLFYLPRIFIYQIEAYDKPEPDRTVILDQLRLMARRLWYIITWPSAIVTLVLGTTFIWLDPSWLTLPFMQVKLAFVCLLYGYHWSLHSLFLTLQKGPCKYSSQQLRLWNEVATVILIAVVFLIVKKDQVSWVWGTLGILGVSALLMAAIRMYKKYRTKNEP